MTSVTTTPAAKLLDKPLLGFTVVSNGDIEATRQGLAKSGLTKPGVTKIGLAKRGLAKAGLSKTGVRRH
jgi:hypothetical protein